MNENELNNFNAEGNTTDTESVVTAGETVNETNEINTETVKSETVESTQNFVIVDELGTSEEKEAKARDFKNEVEENAREYAYRAYAPEAGDSEWKASANDTTQEIKKAKTKKEKRGMTFGKVFATCVAVALIVSILNGAVAYYLYDTYIEGKYVTKSGYTVPSTTGTSTSTTTDDGSAVVTTTTSDDSTTDYTVEEIAEMCLPSVVAITSTTYYTTNTNPFSNGYSYAVSGAGSGIIIAQTDDEIIIVTNYHVVEDTDDLTVEFVDGETYTAYVKGTAKDYDIAVISVQIEDISASTLSSIAIATLGDSDEVSVGEQVVAIGNALGYGQSVTVGYISALNREVTTEVTTLNMIQTDAAINGGNSGGALINMQGQVIGINAAKSSSSSSSSASVEGMGYAIPISDVIDIINELINEETKVKVSDDEKGYLGIKVMTIDEDTAEMYGVPEGVRVVSVVDGSGSDEAGIQKGDTITAINGEKVSEYDDISEILDYISSGETVTVTVLRSSGNGYEEIELEVTLNSYDEIYGK